MSRSIRELHLHQDVRCAQAQFTPMEANAGFLSVFNHPVVDTALYIHCWIMVGIIIYSVRSTASPYSLVYLMRHSRLSGGQLLALNHF